MAFNRSHLLSGPAFVAALIAVLVAALSVAVGSGLALPQNTTLIQISESEVGAFEPAFTPIGDGFATAWYDSRSGNADIYFRLIDGDGRPAGPEHQVTANAAFSYEVDIVTVGANLALAWYEAEGGGYRSVLALWTPEGEELWRRSISNPERNGRIPELLAYEDEIFCAWVEDLDGSDYSVLAGWWDIAGEPVVRATRLMGAGSTTWNLNAKMDSQGQAWVVFDAIVDTEAEELFLARFTRNGELDVQGLTEDDGFASKYPEIALNLGHPDRSWSERLARWLHNGFETPGPDYVAISWQEEKNGNVEVYLVVSDEEGLFEVEDLAHRVTETPGESTGAHIAWNGTRLGLTWNDDTVGQQELYFQSFYVNGEPLGATQRLTNTEAESLIPAIRPWRDSFALVWNEYTPSADGIHGSPEARSEVFFVTVP